jgi:hypothetical protein
MRCGMALLEPSNQQQTRPARSRPRAGCRQRRRRQRRRRWRLHTADLGQLPRVVSAWDGTRTSSPNWGLPGQRLHPRRTPRSLSHHSPPLLRPALPQILSKSLPLTPAQLNQLDGTGTVAQPHTATEKRRASPNPLSATLPRTIPLRARTLPPRLQAPWTAAIEPRGAAGQVGRFPMPFPLPTTQTRWCVTVARRPAATEASNPSQLLVNLREAGRLNSPSARESTSESSEQSDPWKVRAPLELRHSAREPHQGAGTAGARL